MAKRVVSIMGGRPHPMKIAPIARAFKDLSGVVHMTLDLGFGLYPYAARTLSDLGMPQPIETVDGSLRESRTSLLGGLHDRFSSGVADHILIYGDVDVSVDAAIAAQTAGIPYTHIEAGLRSDDPTDHEEANRVFLDRYATNYATHSITCLDRLIHEGVDKQRVVLTGSPQIESLRWLMKRRPGYESLSREYVLGSIHRRETLRSRSRIEAFLTSLETLSHSTPVVLVMYRSTLRAFRSLAIEVPNSLRLIKTSAYGTYIRTLCKARLIVSDSSGSLDEATSLGIPTVVCRRATHRPDVRATGLVSLAGFDSEAITSESFRLLSGPPDVQSLPSVWDLPAGFDIATFIRRQVLSL